MDGSYDIRASRVSHRDETVGGSAWTEVGETSSLSNASREWGGGGGLA